MTMSTDERWTTLLPNSPTVTYTHSQTLEHSIDEQSHCHIHTDRHWNTLLMNSPTVTYTHSQTLEHSITEQPTVTYTHSQTLEHSITEQSHCHIHTQPDIGTLY